MKSLRFTETNHKSELKKINYRAPITSVMIPLVRLLNTRKPEESFLTAFQFSRLAVHLFLECLQFMTFIFLMTYEEKCH